MISVCVCVCVDSGAHKNQINVKGKKHIYFLEA